MMFRCSFCVFLVLLLLYQQFWTYKGQLILKCPFVVNKLTQKIRNFCNDFCPSLLKGVKSKQLGHFIPPLDDFILTLLYTIFFFFFYRPGEKFLQKFRWFFGRFEDSKRSFSKLTDLYTSPIAELLWV